uniref:Uncharacterized protein n=1 Tax=Cacopsylla melanoneura TaxID=428564 RepID=A0A8D9FK56_9HEMI
MPLQITPNTDIQGTITPDSSAARRVVMVGNGNPAHRDSRSSVYVGSQEIRTFRSPAGSSSTNSTNSAIRIPTRRNARSAASRMIRTSTSPDIPSVQRIVNHRTSQVIHASISNVYPSTVLIMEYPNTSGIMRQIIHHREYWSSDNLTKKSLMKKRNKAQGTFKVQVPPREKVKQAKRKTKKRIANDTVHANQEE